MNEEQFRTLMDATGGIREEYIEEAALPRHRRSIWPRAVSVAAAAALLVGMLFVAEFPTVDPGQNSTGGSEGNSAPLLGIRVYAADGLIDLGEATEGTIFAGEEITDQNTDFGLFDYDEVKIFNSETGEWEPLIKEDTERMPKVGFEILWEGYEDYKCGIKIYCNGERVDFNKDRDSFFITWFGYPDRGMVGWLLDISLTEQSVIEFIMFDEDTDTVLKTLEVRITPTIYETEVENDDALSASVAQIEKNEGYTIEVLSQYVMELGGNS